MAVATYAAAILHMKNYINIVFLTVITLMICIISVAIFIIPQEEFSEEENRALAPMPRLDGEDIISGRFFGGLSSFYADRIPLRRLLIRSKAVCELALGKGQNNGVLFSSGGRLVDRLEYSSYDGLWESLRRIDELFEGKQNAAVAVVPRSADVYLEGESVEYLYSGVCQHLGDWNLCDILKQKAEEECDVYYKTDHHLDSEGAYEIYAFIMRNLGYEPLGEWAFDRQMFCDDFYGSIYSKSGLLPLCADEIYLYRYEGDTDYTVRCEDIGCGLDSLYDESAARIKDKYRVFTGGNHGMISISAQSGARRPTLLIYKDSFANAVLPLLARHFDLVVYDHRYTSAPPPTCDYTAIIMGIDTLNS